MARPGMPHADKSLAVYLTKIIDNLQGVKSQRQIAHDLGYDKPNIISMFKRGEMKVPLEKIPAMARTLGIDPGHLYRLALEQYWANDLEAIESVFGAVLTKNEVDIVHYMREISNGVVPPLTDGLKERLSEALRMSSAT